MSTPFAHDALGQLQIIQRRFLEQSRFSGYSGGARMFSAALALSAMFALSIERFPQSPEIHLACWILVALGAYAFNIAAILLWLRRHAPGERYWTQLAPVWFVTPPLVVGAALTVALALRQQYDLLFGMWMIQHSLTHYYASRAVPIPAHRLMTGYYFIAG